MGSPSSAAPAARERRLALLVVDLAGFTRAVSALEPDQVVALLADWLAESGAAVLRHGGRVVKYIGDGCLATFDGDRAQDAVACALELEGVVADVGQRHAVDIGLGVNIHLATVHEGEFGPEADRRHDVLGWGVIHAFKMGAGPGIRISEPVYRSLPSGERSPWRKHQPPATYTRSR